jgi:hypothetical protein
VTATAGRLRRARADDDGVVTAFVVVLTTALLACGALVLDGGRVLAARRHAASLASAAARAGAQEVDVRPSGGPTLIPERAEAAARALLDGAGSPVADLAGVAVTVDGATVTVTVTLHVRARMLGLVGFADTTVRARRTARLVSSSEVPAP